MYKYDKTTDNHNDDNDNNDNNDDNENNDNNDNNIRYRDFNITQYRIIEFFTPGILSFTQPICGLQVLQEHLVRSYRHWHMGIYSNLELSEDWFMLFILAVSPLPKTTDQYKLPKKLKAIQASFFCNWCMFFLQNSSSVAGKSIETDWLLMVVEVCRVFTIGNRET